MNKPRYIKYNHTAKLIFYIMIVAITISIIILNSVTVTDYESIGNFPSGLPGAALVTTWILLWGFSSYLLYLVFISIFSRCFPSHSSILPFNSKIRFGWKAVAYSLITLISAICIAAYPFVWKNSIDKSISKYNILKQKIMSSND